MAKSNQALEAAAAMRANDTGLETHPAPKPPAPAARPDPIEHKEKRELLQPRPANQATIVQAARTKKSINESRIQIAGYLHNQFDVTAEQDTTLEDVLEVDYWKHIAGKLKPLDQITVISEDGTWYARLLVISTDRLWARMYKLEYHDLTKSYENMPKTQEDEYDITWTTISKFGIRKKGNEGKGLLKDGFNTKLEAYQWLDGHLKTLNS